MPAKRPAAEDAKKSVKSARVSRGRVDPNQAKMSAVHEALQSTDTLPDSVIEMLVGMSQHCLLTPKDERHAMQNSVMGMVLEALSGVDSALSKGVQEAEAMVGGADNLKQQRDVALVAAQSNITVLEADLSEKKAKLEVDKASMMAAVAVLKEAETLQAQGDTDLLQASEKKDKMESMVKDALVPSKASGGGDKKLLKDIEKAGKAFDMDTSLMEALQRALKKTEPTRSGFDVLALQEFDNACQLIVSGLDSFLAEGKPGKLEREAAVQAANTTQDAACELHGKGSRHVSDAEAALKQGKADVKTAEKGVSNFLSEIHAAANDLDTKKSALADFQQGPYADFLLLKDPPPPPIEEVEVSEVEMAAEKPGASPSPAKPGASPSPAKPGASPSPAKPGPMPSPAKADMVLPTITEQAA